ncbi:MAG: hypothetical protein AAB840_00345 [Patescibacteria group bacterium]
MKSKNLVVGLGEVGFAIKTILGCDGHDPMKNILANGKYEVLHVCFPYFDGFEKEVEKYKKEFDADLIIIHSSVPMGVSSKLGAVHSPIRGVHPNLEKSIRTFVKFFGGEKAKEASKIFEEFCIKTLVTEKAENTEAMKLWDTTQYGAMILLNKEIYDFCQKWGLDFDVVYTKANRSYNEGYGEMEMPFVSRPYLKYMDGKIGGHCIIPNSYFLDSETPRRIIENNDKINGVQSRRIFEARQ